MSTDENTQVHNPMWDELGPLVHFGAEPWESPRQIGGLHALTEATLNRKEYTSMWSWTVTAPDTVAFVAEHLGPKVIDPLAGSGYWAYLLRQLGADVVATDINLPSMGANTWHRHIEHTELVECDAVRSVTTWGDGRALLLAWPPYDQPIGAQIVAAYSGDRIVYIGELDGGCCGNDEMFGAFGRDWEEIDSHAPVQFWGMHDYINVYQRRSAS